jgi:hypothetical protein
MRSSDIALPSQEELDASVARFQRSWWLVDAVLYGICADYPGHEDLAGVTAKFALVGRVYAAGLERRVTPPKGGQAIEVIGEYALGHGGHIDAILGGLDGISEPLDAEAMGRIVERHGQLTGLLQGVATDGKAPRSFASKYLHFHRPFVPIYDDYARQKLSHVVAWERTYLPFVLPDHGDRQYWDYCLRLFRLYEACLAAGLRVTVKTLDAYLWAVPTSGKDAEQGQ